MIPSPGYKVNCRPTEILTDEDLITFAPDCAIRYTGLLPERQSLKEELAWVREGGAALPVGRYMVGRVTGLIP